MTNPEMRRSRRAWPSHDLPEHTHDLPAWLVRVVWGLLALMVALTVVVALLVAQSIAQDKFITDLREYRDRQQVEMEQRTRRGFCDLLDQFPKGGLLERARDTYGCMNNGYDPDEVDPTQLREQRDLMNPTTKGTP